MQLRLFRVKICKFVGNKIEMKTIVINIEEGSNAKRILEAIRLLKGVENATIATDEELENISMLKALKASRKTRKVSKEEVLNALK
tara:strand:+ start:1097 stop:1354 length:258 start_codon:yes stop_codon:yes gene_type:complete